MPGTKTTVTFKNVSDEDWERIFGKEKKVEPMTEEEIEKAKRTKKHATSGICGEYGMSSFDEKAYKENFERILNNSKEKKEE